jgi:hypothetical protein
MSEDQNIPAEESTDDSQRSTGENPQSLTELQAQTEAEKPTDDGQRSTEENPQSLTDSKLQTTNYKLQTENMEVHKHPHHVTHKKKWGEYLLEFLMLFLAVFLGFVAENIREHIAEGKRAKEYALLMIDDLQTDTVELNKAKYVLSKIILAGDSLGILLDGDVHKITGGKLYFYEYWSGWRWNVISQDATLQQLKSSGSLRYFTNPSIVRKIMDYEQSIQVIYLLQNKYDPEKTANWNLVQKVFDQKFFNSLDSTRQGARDSTGRGLQITDEKLIRFMNTNYPLMNYDKANLQELKNWACNSSRNYRTTRKDIAAAKQKAIDVINALKQEFHLK